VINTDSPVYGGSGVGNLGGLDAMPGSAHGYDQFLPLTVPPLGAVVLALGRVRSSPPGEKGRAAQKP
jgi:1,4-alpha-glucan branching enzyme